MGGLFYDHNVVPFDVFHFMAGEHDKVLLNKVTRALIKPLVRCHQVMTTGKVIWNERRHLGG